MRKFTLFLMSLFLSVGAMAQENPAIVGVRNIPTEKVDLSQGLQTGYYLLKQVNRLFLKKMLLAMNIQLFVEVRKIII